MLLSSDKGTWTQETVHKTQLVPEFIYLGKIKII